MLNKNILSEKGISLRVLEATADEVFKGNAYSSKRVFSDVTTDGKYLLFVAQSDNYIVIVPPTFKGTDGPCIVHMRMNHDYSGGTELTTYNRLLGGDGKQSHLYEDPTGTDTGECFSELLFGETAGGFMRGAGDVADTDLLVLSPGDSVLLHIENLSGSTIDYVSISLTWYEK